MTMNNTTVVQPEQASSGAASQGQAPVPPVSEPLTAEAVQKMIADATAKALTEAKDLGRRELQSQQDKNRAEVDRLTRRAQLAEGTLGATREQAKTLAPEVATTMELAALRAQEFQRAQIEQQDSQRQQQEAYGKTLQDGLVNHLKSLGIDEKDPRIDWAVDAQDYVTGRGRFDTSVAKIVKEENGKMQSGLEKRLADIEASIKKTNVDVNSVPAGAPPLAAAGSDAEFMKNFANGVIPTNKVNVDRYQKILNS